MSADGVFTFDLRDAEPFPMRGPEHSESCRWRGLRCSCGYGKEA